MVMSFQKRPKKRLNLGFDVRTYFTTFALLLGPPDKIRTTQHTTTNFLPAFLLTIGNIKISIQQLKMANADERSADLLKRILTLEFKVFSEQISTYFEYSSIVNNAGSNGNGFELGVSNEDSAACIESEPFQMSESTKGTFLPALDNNHFENTLVNILNKNRGIKKDCSKLAVDLFNSIDLRTDMSSIQRENIAVACAVIRNIDNIGEYLSFCTKGGFELICKWLQVCMHVHTVNNALPLLRPSLLVIAGLQLQ